MLPLNTSEKDKTAQTVLGDMGLFYVIQKGFKVIEKFAYALHGN